MSRPQTVDEIRRHQTPSRLAALWRRVLDPLADEERTSRTQLAGRDPRALDWKLVGLFLVVAVCLTLLEYVGKNQYYWAWIHPRPVGEHAMQLVARGYAESGADAPRDWYLVDAWRNGNRPENTAAGTQLGQLLYWAACCVATYLVVPALYVVLVMRGRLRDYGLRLRGTLRHLWIYAALFAVVLPAVWIVSKDPHFLGQYPFYRHSIDDPRGFWLWQLAYAIQFFSLEFFFRGFMVHGLKPRFGPYAVLIMMVPYVMIHYGKPLPETLGAILAGTVLGVLALRTGSILLGFLIHVSVALTMDLVSIWRQGGLHHVLETLVQLATLS